MFDVFRDLMPLVQFKKCEKHPWMSVNFSNTPPWGFFAFLKLYKWYQIAQRITHVSYCIFYGINPFLAQCSFSINPENVRKPLAF